MAYTPPSGDDVAFRFTGAAYTQPAGNAVPFRFGNIATSTVTATVPIAAAVVASFELPTFSATAEAVMPLAAAVQANTGYLSTVAAVLPIAASVAARIPRYVLSGVVKDGDALVDRRVRVYLRSTGALVTQGDTTDGAFSFEVGTEPDEYLILPVDLSLGATDWSPPCANRVLSVLLTA